MCIRDRVLADVVRHVGGVGQTELLTLVEVGRAGQGEHEGGGRPCSAKTESRVRLRVTDANSVGALRSYGESEPGRVAYDVVVGQHPGGGGADRVRCCIRRGDAVAQVVGAPLRLQEVEVERLVHLVLADVPSNAFLRVDPRLAAKDAVVLARVSISVDRVVGVEDSTPRPVDLMDTVLVPHRRPLAVGPVSYTHLRAHETV